MKLPISLRKKIDDFAEKNKLSSKEKDKLEERVLNRYKKSLVEPHEAVGVIAAQSISEPATQMSLDGSEKVIIKQNDCIKIIEIGKFVDSIINKDGIEDGDWEIADLTGKEIFVPSITNKEKMDWKRVSACSRHEAPERLLRLKTKSGREIVATDSHSFVIRQENKIVPVSGNDLTEGDRIPSIKYLPENCLQELDIKEAVGEDVFDYIRRPITQKIQLNKTWGWIFGAYLAEGNCTPSYVSFSNTDKDFQKNIRSFAKKYSFSYNEYENKRGFSLGIDLRVNATILSRLFKELCGTGSKEKRIPDFVYSADKGFVSGLLNAYFSGDGNVSKEGIRVASRSQELLDGIALLLTRFSIFSFKRREELVIPKKYANQFRDEIGFTVSDKSEKLDNLCSSRTTQEFTDVINGFGSLLKNAAQKLNYPTRYINNFTKRQKIGRETLLRYIVEFQKISSEKGIDISKELSKMKQMFASDVVWDEIVAKQTVKPTSKYVYDFTVEDTETFTTFDGIVTHNTMRSYTLASQSDRLSKVTQGLPRLIEIFDARKTFERNMVIYLEDDFNSKDGAKEIADKIKETVIEDVIESDSINIFDMNIELDFNSKKEAQELKEIIAKKMKGADINLRSNRLIVDPKKDDMKGLRKAKNKIMGIHVRGISRLKRVIIVKDRDDWVIQTNGSNLKEVLKVDGVDVTRTRTNDFYEIIDVLGVEATRNAVLRESQETLNDQGLDVDVRHLMLLADLMTLDGTIRAIGRYGISGEKGSVLAKANFEETKKHLVDASFYGDEENFRGFTENIIAGQVGPFGTGLVDLVVDPKKLRKK